MAGDHYLKRELYDLIQEDSSLFEFLQEGSLDGVWYWDLEEPENEWLSPRFWQLFGYDPSEKKHLASEWQDMINQEDLPIVLSNFSQHCEDPNHPYDQIVRYRHEDGSMVWVRCRGIAIRDHTGKPVRLLGAHTDLTALKRTEEELRQKTIELENTNKMLREALDHAKTLEGLLPICAWCKKIRDDHGYWSQIVTYVRENFLGIEVTDTGKGIAEEKVEEIFEPFYSTKEIHKGCGLGLTIVDEIIKRYGGEIGIRSILKEGTTFIVKIPLGEQND